ncbi:NAD-dependent protein deacylase [Treponema sp.]|uniref:NAD-dependent protein deacylase n=1 Tax=Treponema sp. TaxID=166 RepID=UPI003FA3267B
MNNSESVEKLQRIIDESSSVVFFGGAGVSTESGIPDFRSTDGLYNQQWQYPPETILSRSFFYAQTAEFYRFYRAKIIVQGAKPNPAHIKLAELEKAGKVKAVITQNIDGLHQAAGSKTVYELHGSILRNYCENCRAFYSLDDIIENKGTDGIPRCTKTASCAGVIKPDVVLYEESLNTDVLTKSIEAIQNADTLIIGGTSLAVYPAASLIHYFRGRHLVLVNKGETSADTRADLLIRESIGQVFERLRV